MERQEIVVTVVGDSGVGKTSLIQTFMEEKFPEKQTPLVLEEVGKSVGEYDLYIKDTAGEEIYARLRVSSYSGTNVFVVCFSLSDEVSYQNIKSHWLEELHDFNPNVPLVLVGTKRDEINREVSYQDGLKLQKAINAAFYIECSAKQVTNIKEIFECAMDVHIAPKDTEKHNDCCIS